PSREFECNGEIFHQLTKRVLSVCRWRLPTTTSPSNVRVKFSCSIPSWRITLGKTAKRPRLLRVPDDRSSALPQRATSVERIAGKQAPGNGTRVTRLRLPPSLSGTLRAKQKRPD